MKKTIALIIILAMVIPFAACQSRSEMLGNALNDALNDALGDALGDAMQDADNIQNGDNTDNEDNEDNNANSDQNTEGDQNTDSDSMQGYAGSDALELSNINSDNYIAIAKEIFGFDMTPGDGWTLGEASSPNGVNNLSASFTIPTDLDVNATLEAYFNQCLAISSEGVFAQDINWDTLSVSKGEAYADFESFFDAEGTAIMDFYSVMWIYDFGGKSIQFSSTIELDIGALDLSFTLLG